MNRICRNSILIPCGMALMSGCADDPYQKTKIDAGADALNAAGVDVSRVRSERRGESKPEASKATVEGRSQNRRLGIYLKPVVEGKEQDTLQTPK
ncbi:MAG TPA: hypothetical protein VKP13_11555 [Nitrospira sp.]|nr:hypothetical protein [Nitrospira sp.]